MRLTTSKLVRGHPERAKAHGSKRSSTINRGLALVCRVALAGAFWLSIIPASSQDFSGGQKVAGPEASAMQAANDALAARDWVKAVKLLEPLAQAEPKNAQVLYDLGSAQDALNQESPAEQSYRAAILAAGGYLEPRLALGLLLARQGKMDDARAELNAASSVVNGDKLLRARALRAMARIDQKTRPADARDELLAALAISPETPEDTLMTAELAESANGGQDAAEAAYKRLLVQTPGDPDATSSLAHLLLQEKRYKEAEKPLIIGLEAHPGEAGMSILLAEVYVADGKTDQALPLLEHLHSTQPADGGISRLLAELYIDQKDYAKAEPLLATLVAQFPKDGLLIDLHAEALLHQHQTLAAERTLAPAVANPALFSSTEEWGKAAADLAFAASEDGKPEIVLQVLQNRAKSFATDYSYTLPVGYLRR